MLAQASPYARTADTLRDLGYHPMPVMPGAKVPGEWNGDWHPMRQWSKWCDSLPPSFLHEKWSDWPDAGICIAHGAVVGLDVDTDRKDVAEAAVAAVGPSPVRRTGAKGWMGYYRPGSGLADQTARVRWYDGDGTITVELLLHGTQSVLPPTIHPGTGKPYRWVTADGMEDVAADELPELPADALAKLDAAFKRLGLTRSAPRRVDISRYLPAGETAHDLEKSWGRSINDRAMEPDAIDRWWPALDLPKTRQRGHGSWEAVATWRASNSGRAISDRNPNLKIVPSGIVDFGGPDGSFTPLNLVIAAKGCGVAEAGRFLEEYIRPEEGSMTASEALSVIERQLPEALADYAEKVPEVTTCGLPLGKFLGRDKAKRRKVRPLAPVTAAEFTAAFPGEAPEFPVQDYETDLDGLLRTLTIHLDQSANMRSEQGAFGAALAMLGTIFGKRVEIAETGLRTNLYVVGTADSGAGKSSAMNAMQKVCAECGVSDRLAGSDFTSGAAILNEMNATTAPRLFAIDEFGDVVRRALNPRAAAHERDISRILKDIYSAASGTYRGKSYAGQDRQDIIEPHLCLYGVSTYESFWEGIDGRSYNDGLLARFIAIPIGATEAQTPDFAELGNVRCGIDAACDLGAPKGNLPQDMPRAVPAQLANGLFDRWMADRTTFQRHALFAAAKKRPGAPSIINRIAENGMKISMIAAAGRDTARPEITHDDYDLGLAVAHWSAISMIEAISKYYVENATHRDLNRVFDFINETGAKGCTKSEIVHAFQGVFVNAMAAKNIIDALKGSERIVEWTPPPKGRGRPPTWYVAAKHARQFFKDKGADE